MVECSSTCTCHYYNGEHVCLCMSPYTSILGPHLTTFFLNNCSCFYLSVYKDYEVALSLGHLASLYNYDMERYDMAEELYVRSIAIGK